MVSVGSRQNRSQRSSSERDSSADAGGEREGSAEVAAAGQESPDRTTAPGVDTCVAELRSELEGKNELIAALVAELEQVVEQLDRVKRSGNDRSRSATTQSSLPPEVLEEQQVVLGELQRVVQQWDEMQTAMTLKRIESELSELRSLVAEGVTGGTATVPTDLESVLARLSPEPSPAQDPGSHWEDLKRQMIEDEPDVSDSNDDDDESLSRMLEGVETPAPIDLESASLDVLKKAIADRDAYIIHVTRWIRTRRAVTIPENWEQMEGVPEELVQRVEQLSARLEEQVRLAEVEMSLERARLSREKSQVQSDRAVMERHLKRLGITSLDELEDIAVSSNSAGDRRWMRFLGVNRRS